MPGKIVIKNGHLYRGDEKLQLEFGNVEQIKVLRQYESKIELLSGEGYKVKPLYEVEITAHVSLKCTCGGEVYNFTEAESEKDVECFHNTSAKCRKCSQMYLFKFEGNSLYAFFKETPSNLKDGLLF